MIENLEAMLASGKDNGLLRFILRGEYFKAGIETATQKGDVQAAKEMAVFLGRVQKELDASS